MGGAAFGNVVKYVETKVAVTLGQDGTKFRRLDADSFSNLPITSS